MASRMKPHVAVHALPLLCAACFLDASGVHSEGDGGAGTTSSSGGQAGQPTAGGSGGTGASGQGGTSSGGGGGTEGGAGAAAGGGGVAGGPIGGGDEGGAPPILDCEAQYGLADGHMPCSEDATSCTFRADTDGNTSCDEVCEGFGGECLRMYENGDTCEILREVECNFDRYEDAMCVCSRGCGGNLPCLSPTTCVDGRCSL